MFDWLQKELTRDAPYGATVSFTLDKAQKGWTAPPLSPWLGAAMESASQSFYNKGAMVRSANAQRQRRRRVGRNCEPRFICRRSWPTASGRQLIEQRRLGG